MRISPALLLASVFVLPQVGCKENIAGSDIRPAIPRVGSALQIQEIPFIFPKDQKTDVGMFFHYKRDSEKGFIYLEAETSTMGIVNHLKNKHGIPVGVIPKIIENIDNLTKQFNQSASTKQQVEINVFNLAPPPKLPDNLDSLSDEEFRKIIQEANILAPGLRDFLDTPDKVLEFGINDGVVKDITAIGSLDIITDHGFPKSVHLQKGMTVNEQSAKSVWYIDPRTRSLNIGFYIEINEPQGRLGNGGKNSLLIVSPPAVIVTESKMYLLGFDLLREIPREKYDPSKPPPERGPLPLPHIPPDDGAKRLQFQTV